MSFIHKEYEASIDRFGVEVGTIVWHADTVSEARSVGAQSIGGVPMVTRSFKPDESKQHYLVTLNYEGQSTEGGAPTNSEITETAEGETLFVQEPIETHPSLESLLKAFNGYKDKDGRVKFNATLSSSSTAGLAATSKSGTANPMYGRTTFAVTGCEVLHTYIRERLPSDIFDKINQIIPSLPNSIPARGRPSTPTGRNWMVMCPRWASRGNVVQIFSRYRLSPPGGFPKDMYALFVK